ncbi:hypothetical protein GQ457_13G017030 [Hibiscus cannabinus]
MNRFWWKNTASKNGIHWCSWNVMATPKHYGGMGFRDISKFNVAFLAKQGWRILSNPSSLLARVLKARYFPRTDFLSAQLGSTPSYTWRSIYSAKGLLEKGLGWRIGTGRDVSIWNDSWLLDKGDGRIRDHAIDIQYTRVVDLINPTRNEWNSALVKSIFTPSVAQKILCIPLAKTETDDMLVWRYEGNGHYTPKSGYRLLRDEASVEFRACHLCLRFRWSLPASGIIKINFDTSFLSSTKEAFSGIVARNSTGLIMAACIIPHSDVNDAFVAEAKACESAVLFAIELGFKSVQVEGDSLTVIRKFSSGSLDKSIIQPIITDIKAKLHLFEKITFSHVGRQGNAAAHALARIHTQFQLPRYWVEEAPQEVEQITLADLR